MNVCATFSPTTGPSALCLGIGFPSWSLFAPMVPIGSIDTESAFEEVHFRLAEGLLDYPVPIR